MRRTVVLLTLALSFLAPLASSVAEAAEAGTVQAPRHGTDCRRRRAKKPHDESKSNESKSKKKDKDGKKPYGFEL
jgi:Ni/Co efflux regulator RcnB